MNYVERFRVRPGASVKLKDIDPSSTGDHDGHKGAAKETERYRERLRELQELFYAEGRRSLLICLQALDAGGKDGTIAHLLGSMNPQGCNVVPFKQPTAEELAHDFLWRIHRAAPARREVTIFNRSHYEDVLIVRVHNLVPPRGVGHPVRSDQRVRERSGRGRNPRPQILPSHLQRGATETVPGAARRSGQAVENQRGRLPGAHLLDRLHGGLRGRAVPVQRTRRRAVVRHPRRPQVVPQPGRGPDRGGVSGGAEDDVPSPLGEHRTHSRGVSLREGEESLSRRPETERTRPAPIPHPAPRRQR